MRKRKYIRVKSGEKCYKLLFERMLNGFFIAEPLTDEHGTLSDIRFIKVNPYFEKQVRRKSSDFIGKTWLEATQYPCPDLEIYQRVLTTSRSQAFELYNPLRMRYYLANAFKIGTNLIGVVFEDITPYQKALQEINRLNRQLKAEVAERTLKLQRTTDELETFSYTVAHDLKAPLRSMVGYTQFILEDHQAGLPDELEQMVRKIAATGNNAIVLIDHLLKYGRLTKLEICWEDIDIQTVILETFQKLKMVVPQRVMELKFETALPLIRGDRILIKEIVYNVLDNAVKFTRDRAVTLITVGCRMSAAEHQVYIQDNGVGFEMEYAGKLFGVFERLHTQEEFEGSGIGLALVRKVMTRHGGRTWIEARLNKGAIVYLAFPKKETMETRGHPKKPKTVR
jgi:signal transduction histidine kinase